MSMLMIDDNDILKLAKHEGLARFQCDPVLLLDMAMRFLGAHGAPLTQEQREVLFFAVSVGHKDEHDTWDQGIPDGRFGDPAWKRAARLLRKEAGFEDEG